ncbi:uncharacterized protein LOC108096961 [Drosophila ficusphila]|uniref:uncharacterized protein LOC108096961 n=1 Tax=Drosophila ficusphila TaxID=30025 RepID=UPI0007E70F20|nr:uncharacterized protein LOC108096961 [Drosophila ficusphila]
MDRKCQKCRKRKKVKVVTTNHHSKCKKTNCRKKHHVQTQRHAHRHPKDPTSKVFHKNCCKYKTHSQSLKVNQCNLATQCPSRTIPIAASVPLLQHPVRRTVVKLPETVVIHMRNEEDARRVANSCKRTLLRSFVPGPMVQRDENSRGDREIDLRPRRVYRNGRARPSFSEMDLKYENSFQ